MTLPSGRTTNIIAVATLLVFLLTELGGFLDVAAIVGGFIPARVGGVLAPQGLPFTWLPLAITPLSAALLHNGWMHIGFNMLMLLFCGRQVETVLGRWPLVTLYVVGAYAAAAAQWAADPMGTVPMVGASGAISALMGTYALLYSRQNVRPLGPIPASVVRVLWLAAGWIALQALLGFAMSGAGGIQIAVAAHVGGFIAGLLLTRPLLKWRFRTMAAH
ncbi:rhomboid family intramembrane serine protease [Sphingobium sufflavum]|uniref:rhomboid family intramembrane serine protease n=1 Tax=Sphingobium sufflavum TaxID=1129547 RepID=UPI001F15FD59|nr:rhomboid family intramembrane serine protease [Sphingobium sufflavum]MCE7797428.1 rhomboid family intramembrane serine protease [Sphingobium sufflavum]